MDPIGAALDGMPILTTFHRDLVVRSRLVGCTDGHDFFVFSHRIDVWSLEIVILPQGLYVSP